MKARIYKYTKGDIAKAARVSEGKVRADIRRKEFLPESIESTSAYIMSLRIRVLGF